MNILLGLVFWFHWWTKFLFFSNKFVEMFDIQREKKQFTSVWYLSVFWAATTTKKMTKFCTASVVFGYKIVDFELMFEESF